MHVQYSIRSLAVTHSTQPLHCLQEGGDRATRATAHLISRLVSTLADTDATAAQPPSPQLRSSGQRAAAIPPLAAAQDGSDTAAAAAHAAALDRIRSFTPPLALSAAAGSKRAAVDAVPAAGSKRFRVAEAWSPCPVGTLPSGIPGVGTTPIFRWAPAAKAVADSAAADDAGAPSGEEVAAADDRGPGEGASGEAPAETAVAGGGAGAAVDTTAARRVHAIETAAQGDALAALGAVSGFVWEDVGVEDEVGGSGVSGVGVDGATGAEGSVEVLGLRSLMRGGPLQEPADAEARGLREVVLRACGLVS